MSVYISLVSSQFRKPLQQAAEKTLTRLNFAIYIFKMVNIKTLKDILVSVFEGVASFSTVGKTFTHAA